MQTESGLDKGGGTREMRWFRWGQRGKSVVLWAALLMVLAISGQAMALEKRAEDGGSSTVSTDAYNIMLIIDKSGSMNATDKEHMAQDAAKMFVDSLNLTDGLQGSRVGVISFSDSAQLLTTPVELNSQGQADYVKSEIESIVYDRVNTGGTDLGEAVELAVETLNEQNDSGREDLILLFTDGYIDGQSQMAREESETLLEEELNVARDMGCEIYVIGLNYKRNGSSDTIKQKGRDKIAEIARRTQLRQGIYPDGDGNRVNYLITDSLKQVYDFYANVYAVLRGSRPVEPDHIEVEEDDGTTNIVYDIPVTEADVIEANIFLITEQEIGEVAVYDPAGTLMVIDGDNVSLGRGRQYVVVKLTKPSIGVWKIKVPKQTNYFVTYVLSRGIELSVRARKDGQQGDAVVNATVMYKLEKVDNPRFYQELTTYTFTVTSQENGQEFTQDLEYDSEEGCMRGDFRVQEEGNYQITVTIGDEQFQRTASTTAWLGPETESEETTANEIESQTDENKPESSTMSEEPESETVPEEVPAVSSDVDSKYGGLLAGIVCVILAVLSVAAAAMLFYQKRIRKLDGQFRITIEGGGLGYPYSFTKTPFRGSSIRLDVYLQEILEQEFGRDASTYRQLCAALKANKKELHDIVLILQATKRGSKFRETYMFCGRNRRKKTLGGEIFRNQKPEDRGLWLRVDMEYLSPEKLESDEKGW